METLILLIVEANKTLPLTAVTLLKNYLGIRNLNNTINDCLPGCVYNGTFTSEEKSEIVDYMLRTLIGLEIYMLFIETEPKNILDNAFVTAITEKE